MVRKVLFLITMIGLFLMALAVPAMAQTPTPVDVGELAPVIAWLVGAVLVFGPGARGVTWIVDRVRDIFDKDDSWSTWVSPGIALLIALLACLGWEINVIGGLFQSIPRFTDSTALNGTMGQVFTAFGMAGFASSWHDRDKRANPPALPKTGK